MGNRRKFLKDSGNVTLGMSSGLFTASLNYFHKDGLNDMDKKSIGKQNFSCLVGLSEKDITPKIGSERPANYRKVYNKTFHDACKIRTIVYDNGKKCVALVGIDALCIPKKLVDNVRKRVSTVCSIEKNAIMIGASHSHTSGPLGFVQPGQYDHADSFVQKLAYDETVVADPYYLKTVEDSLVDSICEAYKNRKNSQIAVGIGYEEKAGVNRRYFMSNGLIYTYPGRGNPQIIGPAGPIDPDVGVIGIWDNDGKFQGCVVNFARHANCPVSGISANWIYYMEKTIRGAMGEDSVVVFLAGANGNVSHDNLNDPYVSLKGNDKARYVGTRVGAEVVKVLLSIPRGNLSPVNYISEILKIKRRIPSAERVKECYRIARQPIENVDSTEWIFAKEIVLLDSFLQKEPIAEVEVQAIQIGPTVFISSPAEYFTEFGLEIKKASQFKYTFPVELANGSVGYVPTLESFSSYGGGYETRLTSYSNLEITAGNQIRDKSIELIRSFTPGEEPSFPEPDPYKNDWSYGNVKPELE